MNKYTIYCDGAYSSSRNRMGYAFVVLEESEKIYSNYYSDEEGTNNRAEILACMNALKWCKLNGINEVTIITDSMYLIGTMSKSWKRNKNIDLWIEMDKAAEGISIEWTHIKGHSGDKWNEYCDTLATYAYNY